jgi:hypothetical protein
MPALPSPFTEEDIEMTKPRPIPKQRTKQQKIIAALVDRGYRITANPRGARYVELVLRPGGQSLLRSGQSHKLLVSRSGSLRWTRGAHQESMLFSDFTMSQLLP